MGINYRVMDYKKLDKLSPFELKNRLLAIAGENSLNAGRGNPNFFNKFVRQAFSYLQLVVLELSHELIKGELYVYPEEGDYRYYEELNKLIKRQVKDKKIVEFLEYYMLFLKRDNKLLHDVVMSTIGCYYPVPPQIQPHLSIICEKYMYNNVFRDGNAKLGSEDFEYFACEGAAAGIMYVFNTLSYNGLMKRGDKCAIMTPIFSPYLEMPKMDVYGLDVVILKGDANREYEVSTVDLDKLKSRDVKVLFMVNPENPSDYTVTDSNVEYIKNIVKNYNRDLIIVTDDVYSPFVEKYNSLMAACPDNTILIQSLSKYFGVTGWRLGMIMLKRGNRMDRLLRGVLERRYNIASVSPSDLTLMERLVLDSRQVAGGHVAGLSTPQQVLMGMFLVWDYRDKRRVYQGDVMNILRERMELLYGPLKTKPRMGKNETNYYSLVDIMEVTENLHGKGARGRIEKHHPLEVLFYLAYKYKTVLLPGRGFGANKWQYRVSIANLRTEEYKRIGENIVRTIGHFVL